MNVFKIARKILADYIYDPDHVKNPPAHFHQTEKGWSDSKGSSKSKSFYKENVATLSPYAMSFVKPFLEEKDDVILNKNFGEKISQSKNLSSLLKNLSNDSNARKMMNKKVEESLNNGESKSWDKVNRMISDYGKIINESEVAGTFSRLIGLSMGNGGEDWRMKKHSFKNPSKEMVKDVRFYEKNEQELLLHSGLVDESGYVTVYRNTYNPPVDGVYIGSFVESWSLTPEIKETRHRTKSFLITVTVPLSKVVASCIGRRDGWIHSDNYEILIESSYLTNVRVVSSENITIESQDCFDKIRDNYKSIDKVVENENKRNFVNSLKLENLSDIENPTNEDLIELRKMSEEYRGMTQTELIIMFKTLVKEGVIGK